MNKKYAQSSHHDEIATTPEKTMSCPNSQETTHWTTFQKFFKSSRRVKLKIYLDGSSHEGDRERGQTGIRADWTL